MGSLSGGKFSWSKASLGPSLTDLELDLDLDLGLDLSLTVGVSLGLNFIWRSLSEEKCS